MRGIAPRERAAMALRLSSEVFALARRAIKRSFPELNEAQQGLKFIEIHYGAELAERVRAWLAARGRTV
jgi:hypothetical protein